MFDIGWSELMVLGAVALIVVGPKDLPGLLRTLGQVAGKARRMAREFQGAMDEAAREADVKELRDVQKSMSDWNRRIGTGSAKAYAEKMMSGASDAPRAAASGDPAAERPAPSAGAAPPSAGSPGAAPPSAGSPGAASAEPAPDSADAPPPREG